jgi:hypothetical protein
MGLCSVIADPRTDLIQSLEAIRIAELADNDAWEALAELMREAGEQEIAEQFDDALANERQHLDNVRSWLTAAQGRTGEHMARAPESRSTSSGGRRKAGRAPTPRRARTAHPARAGARRTRKKGAKSRKRAKSRGRRAR